MVKAATPILIPIITCPIILILNVGETAINKELIMLKPLQMDRGHRLQEARDGHLYLWYGDNPLGLEGRAYLLIGFWRKRRHGGKLGKIVNKSKFL